MNRNKTLEYKNTKKEAEKTAKSYKKEGIKVFVRRHPKWHTWDVMRKVPIKTKRRTSSPFGINIKYPRF